MTTPPQRCIRIASSTIIISSACGALLLLNWSLDRGLNVTDESTLLYDPTFTQWVWCGTGTSKNNLNLQAF
jgi:hypothetical protein